MRNLTLQGASHPKAVVRPNGFSGLLPLEEGAFLDAGKIASASLSNTQGVS